MMLVLARKVGETIELNGGFDAGGQTIVVVELRGDKVRLGILAPRDQRVYRGEIADIVRSQEAAEAST